MPVLVDRDAPETSSRYAAIILPEMAEADFAGRKSEAMVAFCGHPDIV
jgi:hypothetical protein